MKKINVLVTSAGVATAVNVISALRLSKKYQFKIVAIDASKYASGLYLADKYYLVPTINNPYYFEKIVDICKKECIDIIFPLFSKEISIFAEKAKFLKELNFKLLLPEPKIVEICDNKVKFYQFLENYGFCFPKLIKKPIDNNQVKFPLFMKPIKGSSTKNSFKIENPIELNYFLYKYPDNLIQEFIEGKEYTIDCLAIEGRTIAAIPRIRLNVKDGKTIVGKTIKHLKIIELSEELIKNLKFHGPCNIQIIENNFGDCFIIEMNPRLAAGGLPLSVRSGVNIPELIVDYLMGNQIQPIKDFQDNLVMIRFFNEIFFYESN